MAVQSLLDPVIRKTKARPKYLICDKGKQSWCESFKGRCGKKGVQPRFGAVGKRGGIAAVERFIGSLKGEWVNIVPVPFREWDFRRELAMYVDWYNWHRPHSTLRAQTPAEVVRNALEGNTGRSSGIGALHFGQPDVVLAVLKQQTTTLPVGSALCRLRSGTQPHAYQNWSMNADSGAAGR